MSMTIPLVSIYNYDNTLLDGLHVPDVNDLPADIEYISPIPELSDATLHMQLLFELGEMSPVYTDPDVLKKMIEIWSEIQNPNWLQLWQTTLLKYNPIWNKDGSYTETRAFQLAGHKTGSVDFDESRSSTESGSETKSGTASSSSTHSVTGYDTNALSPASGETGSGTSGENNSASATGSQTTSADTGTVDDETRSENETISRIDHGNIGVTTTQQMIKEQREVVEFNIYRFIIDSFKKQFMVMLWDI